MKYYQLLLKECIALQKDYKRLRNMKKTLKTMKSKLCELGGID